MISLVSCGNGSPPIPGDGVIIGFEAFVGESEIIRWTD
jgi:hypothetical protein